MFPTWIQTITLKAVFISGGWRQVMGWPQPALPLPSPRPCFCPSSWLILCRCQTRAAARGASSLWRAGFPPQVFPPQPSALCIGLVVTNFTFRLSVTSLFYPQLRTTWGNPDFGYILLQCVRAASSLSSGWHCFWREVGHHSYHGSAMCTAAFLGCFSDFFSLSLGLSNLIMMWLDVVFFIFILLSPW